MPTVNTHSLNSYCSDVSDMILLFLLNSTSFTCSQSQWCYALYSILMGYWPSIVQRQYQNLTCEFGLLTPGVSNETMVDCMTKLFCACKPSKHKYGPKYN